MELRINKYLSTFGVCSRRQADRWLEEGRIKINGKIANVGQRVQDGDRVEVDNKEIATKPKRIYLKFYKPRGVVCTTAKFDKDNIIDYIGYDERIYPVGRLDKDSEGLLILTNDGSIVNPILKGSNNHQKTYIVEVDKKLSDEKINKLKKGVPILDTLTKPCEIVKLGGRKYKFIISQGLNRQIRRMCEYVGVKVLSLKRIKIMDIELGDLRVGDYIKLNEVELAGIKAVVGETNEDR